MTQGVKAVARVEGIRGTDLAPDGVGTYTIIVGYVGLDPALPPITDDLLIPSVAPGTSMQDIQKMIAAAVKAQLISEHGYSFAPQDSVQVFGF